MSAPGCESSSTMNKYIFSLAIRVDEWMGGWTCTYSAGSKKRERWQCQENMLRHSINARVKIKRTKILLFPRKQNSCAKQWTQFWEFLLWVRHIYCLDIIKALAAHVSKARNTDAPFELFCFPEISSCPTLLCSARATRPLNAIMCHRAREGDAQ